MARKDLLLKPIPTPCPCGCGMQGYMLLGVYICAEAGRWLRRHWPKGAPLREAWAECNVPTWMLFILDNLDRENEAVRSMGDSLWSPPDLISWSDNEAREDFADALRVIFPVRYVEMLARQAVQS